MQVPPEITDAEIEDAIVACLRIFAARGRALRQQREKLANVQRASENAPCVSGLLDREPNTDEMGREP